jgi:energy-coupling factor transport system permease protein
MLIEYYPSNSFLHRLDVRTKTLWFIIITFISFRFDSPVINLVLVLTLWLMIYLSGSPLSTIKHVLKPLIPIFIIMLVVTGFTYPAENIHNAANKKVLFAFPGNTLPLTIGGVLYGFTLVLRIFVMVLASSLITLSTSIEDIIQFLKKIKLPYQVAFVIATGLRFIPTMQKKSEMIQDAQRARGANPGKGGIVKSIKSFIPVLIPMIVDSIRMSDNLAMATLNRGFGSMKKTTDLHEIKMQGSDYIICAAGIILMIIMILAGSKITGVI